MPIAEPVQNYTQGRIFLFDFGTFCAILNVGRTQAACSSHQEMAPSTFSSKIRSEVIRAHNFTQTTLSELLGRLLQMPNQTHLSNVPKSGFGRAVQAAMAAPALFHKLPFGLALGWRDFCAIWGFSLIVRAEKIRANLAVVFVRPQIQKVRIC